MHLPETSELVCQVWEAWIFWVTDSSCFGIQDPWRRSESKYLASS